MPLSQYDKLLGGPGSANKLMSALKKQYGPQKGTSVFYAKVSQAKKKHGGKS